MSTEVKLLLLNGFLNRNSINDILLRPILDANETKSQLNILTLNHSLSVCTLVHDIDLGNDTNSPNTLLVSFSRHLKTI